MISIYKHKTLTWIDLEVPTADEVKSLMNKYAIHPNVAEELLKQTRRPRSEIYKNFVYLILHFPIFDPDRRTSVGYELDFIIGKNFLITVHYKSIAPLFEIAKLFEVGSMIGNGNSIKDSGALAFHIIKQFYIFGSKQLGQIQGKIDRIEENIFKGHEQEMVETISYVHRDILDFQRCLHEHVNILETLEDLEDKFLGIGFRKYVKTMYSELAKVKNLAHNCKETIESLQKTNDSLLTDKTNQIMRTLTIMAFVTFPLMLFASVFSMNTNATPIIGMKGDFWLIVGLMIISMTTMIMVFKRKKWL